MSKEKIKGFIAGFAAASLIAGVIPVVAEKISKTAELYYNDIKVVVDGKRADLKDANGNPVEPFIYEGTTYLPVRAVANVFNKAVAWDGATQTVYLGENEEIAQPTTWLKDLETFTGYVEKKAAEELTFGGTEYNEILTDNAGNVYKNYWYPESEDTTYLLNYKYSKFKGTFYLRHDSKDYHHASRMLVYGDGNLLYESDKLTAGSMPIEFDVDVSNVAVLKIEYQSLEDNNEDYSWCVLNSHIGDGQSSAATPIGNAGLYE